MEKFLIEEISEGLTLLRTNDRDVKSFEGVWEIPEGVTYNSYLLKSGGKTFLFDGWKIGLEGEFLKAVKKVSSPEDIDYVIIHHTEPDHSGTLPALLDANGYKAQVVGHRMAGRLMNSFYGVGDRMKFRAVDDGEKIEGLRFIHAPWLHWPDTIFTHIEEKNILLTGDAFGGFSIPTGVFNDSPGNYLPFVRKYIIDVVGHYKEHITKNAEKLGSLGIKPAIIAPAHGLIWRDPEAIVNFYLRTAAGEPKKGKVTVFYDSMYGFVEGAVGIAVRKLKERGCDVKEFSFTDKSYSRVGDLLGEISDSEAIIIGASTYEAGLFPYSRFVIELMAKKANFRKPVLLLTSCGWGNAARMGIEAILEKTDLRIVDTVEFRGAADEETEKKISCGLKKLLG